MQACELWNYCSSLETILKYIRRKEQVKSLVILLARVTVSAGDLRP